LALRIAGARLAARPGWPVRALAGRLADEQHRLDELELAGMGVRASLTVSYQQLSTSADPVDRAAARAFLLLGVQRGADVGVPAAARLLDRSQRATEQLLERLADAQLLETSAPGHYRPHDLMRLYAAERDDDSPHDREAATAGCTSGICLTRTPRCGCSTRRTCARRLPAQGR
jgi:hypothetical protein